jgi:hypothetical protein
VSREQRPDNAPQSLPTGPRHQPPRRRVAAPARPQGVCHERTDEEGDGEGGHDCEACGYEDCVEDREGREHVGGVGMSVFTVSCIDSVVVVHVDFRW